MKKGVLKNLGISAPYLLLAASCTSGTISGGGPGDNGLAVTGVQLHIDESIYASPVSFEAAMRGELEAVCSGPDRPDLVVFPEYTSVFLAAADYFPVIEETETFEEAIAEIGLEDAGIRTLYDFFKEAAGPTEVRLDRIWGKLAREFGIAIAAGTCFRTEADEAGNTELRNTLLIYGPKGRRIYEQDKVYLTDFEKTVIGLSPGCEEEAAPVQLQGYDIAFTICRDSFFSSWEDNFKGAVAWISIKANGVTFDREARRSFQEALPERIAESDVPYGMVVCLNGRFLDLFWEGESSVIVDAGEKVRIVERARTPWSGDTVDLILSLEGLP